MSYACCYSSRHLCTVCGNNFACGGAGGFSGTTTTPYGITTCEVCQKYAPIPSICWTCYKKFSNRGNLFRHLKMNNHYNNKPTKCGLCHSNFLNTSIIGSRYSYRTEQIYEHLTNCVDEKKDKAW